MGNFSRETFDALKHFVGVRLQQGVPIVDADWNEMEDIKKYELQSFLKWFVGNGVPEGNNGFEIVATGANNDFSIRGGNAQGPGYIIVDGWDVINESDMLYSAQPLYDNNALALQWGVTSVPPLEPPAANRIDLIYLDVWEREVDGTEDPDHLINPAIGIETAVRVKREWAVRVAEGAGVPSPTGNHTFYTLAVLNRVGGQAAITSAQVVDRRRTGLTIISGLNLQQIVTDAFGSGYSLDLDGQPNLKVSLREAINALMQGSLPGTPETQLTTGNVNDIQESTLIDSSGDIWVFWHSQRSGNGDVWYKSYSQANGAWSVDAQLTTDEAYDSPPRIIEDSLGNIWAFWVSYRSGNSDVWYDRYDPSAESWLGNTPLTTDTGSDDIPRVVIDNRGRIWAFWYSTRSGNGDIWYDRYDPATDTWLGNTQLTTDADFDYEPFVVADNEGDIWAFWRSNRSENNDIWHNRYSSATDSWQGDTRLTYNTETDYSPVALVDSRGDIWLMWISFRSGESDIWYRRFSRVVGYWQSETALTSNATGEQEPFLVEGSNGDIWVFWSSWSGSTSYIFYKRYTLENGWGDVMQLSGADGAEAYMPTALLDPDGDIWAFWWRYRQDYSASHIWYRTLISRI